MSKVSLQRPPAWLMVMIGLALNVAAILLTGLVLDKLSNRTMSLVESKQLNDHSIQRDWVSIDTLERKREQWLLLNAQGNILALNIFNRYFAHWMAVEPARLDEMSVEQVMRAIDEQQTELRDRIDAVYLESLSIMDQIQTLSEQQEGYKILALLMQVFGLALILARDLSKR